MGSILQDPAFAAVREFADILIDNGRDRYGERHSPLFATQLNVDTGAIPAGTPEDPGVWLDDPEVAGIQPFCQNLLFDLGLLDVLRCLTAVTGDAKYDTARRDYLAYLLAECRHPVSGYIPWGEHVGYDIVHDRIHQGDWKGQHEVKSRDIPWDQLWGVDPVATRHEIEVALRNHVYDEETFAFNRHADMSGGANDPAGEKCSLSSSGGLYMLSWCWLAHKTGDDRYIAWARKVSRLYSERISPTTGLFPTDEARFEELWYAEPCELACFLLRSAQELGSSGSDLAGEAVGYLLAYDRVAYDPSGPGYFDTVNIVTGKPVIGPSKHYPQLERPAHLSVWTFVPNCQHVGTVVTGAALGYAMTGDRRLRDMLHRALAIMDVPGVIRREQVLPSGDAAGVLFALVNAARTSGDASYLEQARPLVEYLLQRNRRNGCFTSGLADGERYYCARAGSADLAAAILAYAVTGHSQPSLAPPVRDFLGGMRA